MRRGEIVDHGEFKVRPRGHAERMERLARINSGHPPLRMRQRETAGNQSRYTRSVIVKVTYRDRSVCGRGMVAGLARYIEKEGPMFDRAGATTAQEVSQEWGHDRRVFHVIVSPEDGGKLTHAEMQEFARNTVSRWEERLGHKLEWAASVEDKPDSAHPEGNKHLHIMIRGEKDGQEIFIERDVIKEGLRHDAKEAMTDRLGYMTHTEYQELQQRIERRGMEAEQEQKHEHRQRHRQEHMPEWDH